MNIDPRTASRITEAANRAEATALLLRLGYRLYRPEVDIYGEDLVVRRPEGELIGVQLKGRPFVHEAKYGGRELWMLFPSAKFDPSAKRDWFLVPHDDLFAWFKERHGHTPGWQKSPEWNTGKPSRLLLAWLAPYKIAPPAEPEMAAVEDDV